MIFLPVVRRICLPLLVLTNVLVAHAGTDGRALIERARKLSDIRADGVPAFQMEAQFQISPRDHGNQIDGTYREIWFSRSQWRREIQAGPFHQLEIVSGANKWVVKGADDDRVDPALYRLLTLIFSRTIPKAKPAKERVLDGVGAVCIQEKRTTNSEDIDCFDPNRGVLLLQETSFNRPDNSSVLHSCQYSKYESFGDRLFPRSIHCSNVPGSDINFTITKIAADPSPDNTLFVKPAGAVETRNCLGTVTAPRAVVSPDPAYPASHSDIATVVLWLIVGEDGNPRDAQIARSAGKDFDKEALSAIRGWRFKPSTCDGDPVAAQVNVEMTFRRF